ncbi:MAG TPA: hypothetical protein VFK87_04165 [Steroidobacteraceae bacterium]|nr:hypothetical protein [Steroidobacteraceae bacterium]
MVWVHRAAAAGLYALLLLPGAAAPAPGSDPCAGFSRDVRRERALFAGDARDLAAGRTAAAAPALATGQLYELELSAQPEVSFVAPPGRVSRTEATYAGLATLSVTAAGIYQIALDQAAWVDVLAHGVAIRARDFQGRPGCSAPHKLVEFELPAATPLVLQFSGAVTPSMRVTVSRAHAPAAPARARG